MDNGTKRLHTVKQACEVIPVSPSGLYRKLHSGELPGPCLGQKVLVNPDEVSAKMGQPPRATKRKRKQSASESPTPPVVSSGTGEGNPDAA